MSKEQVVELLGQPSQIANDEWYYERVGNPGWVDVRFGEDGKVLGMGDESAFPQWK